MQYWPGAHFAISAYLLLDQFTICATFAHLHVTHLSRQAAPLISPFGLYKYTILAPLPALPFYHFANFSGAFPLLPGLRKPTNQSIQESRSLQFNQ